jgi:4-amino-4-deoxy-L-arabinose transferase-like glycosyltransferase
MRSPEQEITVGPSRADNPLRTALDWLARKPWRAFLIIFILSFSIQSFFLTKVSERYIRPHTRWEQQAIAVSLAERGEFADPYMLATGPTAHLPPIPPAIFGLTYKLFGLTLAAGYIGWLINMAILAAVWALLPWLAWRVGLGGQAGVLAGFAGAFIPRWPGHGEGLTALAMALLMVAFVRRWMTGRSTKVGSLLLGVAAGVAFHVQPALLPVVLGWMAFDLWWSKDRRRWLSSTLVTLGIVVACLPWGWRNYQTFHAVFFIRSNFGLELRMGNHEGAAAAMDVMDSREEFLHPRTHESEARKVQELGEVAYMRQAGREAMVWIEANPWTFLKLTASRVGHWWLGPLYYPPGALLVTALTLLALLGGWLTFPSLAVPQRAALLIPLVTYPLIYYIVAYMPRYREPIDWIFFLLAGTALWRLIGGLPSRTAGVDATD